MKNQSTSTPSFSEPTETPGTTASGETAPPAGAPDVPADRGTGAALVVVYAAIALDAAGIGLVFPILPRLIAEVAGEASVAPAIGMLAALYAVMQFVCAPVLGALSDRLGRRPVLLLSLGGGVISYGLLALAPSLALLFLGRAVAGLTAANVSVATAAITDLTPPEKRARRFGLANAMFGAGFIVGPVLGGALGDHWVRLPFIVAAGLTAVNCALAFAFLRESHPASRGPLNLAGLNPLRPLRAALTTRALRPFVLLFFVFSATGEAYGTCWALWGADAFRWSGLAIGLSLGAFGLCQALAQAFLPGPAVRRLGARRAILAGVGATSIALAVLAFARQGWLVFAIMPLFALGGIGVPALQSLATEAVDEERQGQLQGVLASAVSLASIIAPLGFSSVYGFVRGSWPGAVWLVVIAVYALAVPLVLRLSRAT